MRIQYISDIHLEFVSALLKEKRFSPQAEILCLAGDIGYPGKPIYRNFLKTVSGRYKKVFLITGNHEYYGQSPKSTTGSSAADEYSNCESMDDVHDTIRRVIADLPNITFLDNSFEDYEGFRFIGTTLWSKIPARPGVLINDFNKIPDMTPALYNELHDGACEYLEEAIAESPLPVVVITHHLPSYDLIDTEYIKYDVYNAFFASNCDRLFKPAVKAWIYGHTHKPARNIIQGIQFACNPVGYPSESEKRDDFNAVIDVA